MSRDDPSLISLAFTFGGYASYTNLKKNWCLCTHLLQNGVFNLKGYPYNP